MDDVIDTAACGALASSLAEEDGELEAFNTGFVDGDPRPGTNDWFVSQAMRVVALLRNRGFDVVPTPAAGDASEDGLKQTISFAIKHKTKLLPRSKIAGSQDDMVNAAAEKIVTHILSSGYVVTKKPPAPLHSADCGKRL